MLSKEEIEMLEEANATELAQKIYRVQEYILEEINKKGEISQFKEDILYIIHNLLQKQLSKEEQTACEIVIKQQEARIQLEREKYMQKRIEQLETNNKKLIEKLEEDIEITKKQYGENTLLNIRADGKLDTLEEILEIAKGENNV